MGQLPVDDGHECDLAMAPVLLPTGRSVLAVVDTDGWLRLWDPVTRRAAGAPTRCDPADLAAVHLHEGRVVLASTNGSLWEVVIRPS